MLRLRDPASHTAGWNGAIHVYAPCLPFGTDHLRMRPDAHIAWARNDLAELAKATSLALGNPPTDTAMKTGTSWLPGLPKPRLGAVVVQPPIPGIPI